MISKQKTYLIMTLYLVFSADSGSPVVFLIFRMSARDRERVTMYEYTEKKRARRKQKLNLFTRFFFIQKFDLSRAKRIDSFEGAETERAAEQRVYKN